METIRKIKMLILDVDGVLTRGEIVWDSEGRESKLFNSLDGLGLKLLHDRGIRIVIITARKSVPTEFRFKDLGFGEIYQEVKDKLAKAKELSEKYGISSQEICFIGDDLNDLPLLLWVGFPVAVKNAVKEVKRVAKYITSLEGGKGAVREVVDLILAFSG
ncbi:MAG: HAD hydrolase family protein [Synergistetes bacterium]|nr:HAD hydrolase family protein [Synergistota bacterium]MDW8193116.1 HAD hydrolase family protein [Synergistota bacterium]